MPVYLRSTVIPAPVATLADWHFRAGAIDRLNPSWLGARILQHPGAMVDGSVARVGIPLLGMRFTLAARHKDAIPGQGFTDVQEQGPFARWEHRHRFLPHESDHSTVEDRVDYQLPMGALGAACGGGFAHRMLERGFTWRHQRTRHDLSHHALWGGQHLRIAVSGTTGMVGRELVPFLTTAGHDVRRIVRSAPDHARGDVHWDQTSGTFDARALEGLDAVIHLAAPNLVDRSWTAERMRQLRDDRVNGAHSLSRTLASLKNPPRVFLCASATGFYGPHAPSDVQTEDSPHGTGYLAELCRDWEAATEPAKAAGIRVVNMRIGGAIGYTGGILGKLRRIFALGAGGRVGDGRQMLSWIALDDLLGAIRFVMSAPVSGPVNLVSPTPVSNAEFTRTLARVLHRPAFMHVPAVAVRTAMGQMGQALMLEGVSVLPTVLQRNGFHWNLPTLESAIRFELGRL